MDEEFVKKMTGQFTIGSDISNHSVEDIAELIKSLRVEIQRLTEILAKKQAQKSAAESLFKSI